MTRTPEEEAHQRFREILGKCRLIYTKYKAQDPELGKRLVDALNGVGLGIDGLDMVWMHRAILLKKFVEDFNAVLTQEEITILLETAKESEHFFRTFC